MPGFDKLSLCQKFNLLVSKGKLLKSVIHENRKVNLYAMEDKYYGVWFDASENLIDRIKEIKDKNLIQKYF